MSEGSSFSDPFSDAEHDVNSMREEEEEGRLPPSEEAAPAHTFAAFTAAAPPISSLPPASSSFQPPRLLQLRSSEFCTVSSWSEDDDDYYKSGGHDNGCCQHSCSSSISSLGPPPDDDEEVGMELDAAAVENDVDDKNNDDADAAAEDDHDDLMMVFDLEPSDPQDGGHAEVARRMLQRRFGTDGANNNNGGCQGRRGRRGPTPTVVSSGCSTLRHLSSSFDPRSGNDEGRDGNGAADGTDYEGERCDYSADLEGDWEESSCDSVPTIEMNLVDVGCCEGCSRAADDEDMDDDFPHHIVLQQQYDHDETNRRQHHHQHWHQRQQQQHHQHQHPFPQTIHTYHHHASRCENNLSAPEADLELQGASTPAAAADVAPTQASLNLLASQARAAAAASSSGPDDPDTSSTAPPAARQATQTQSAHNVVIKRHAKNLHLLAPRRPNTTGTSSLLRCPPSSPDLPTTTASSFLPLPDEMATTITSYLDVPSLVALRETCSKMRDLASRNEAGWAEACRRLWRGKANVCREARSMMEEADGSGSSGSASGSSNARSNGASSGPTSGHGSSARGNNESQHRQPHPKAASEGAPRRVRRRRYGAMGAYRVSVRDAAARDVVTVDELCYDGGGSESRAGGPVWSFRFKESAGPDWTGWDPWWDGRGARKMVFMRDGTVMQLVPREEIAEEEGGLPSERQRRGSTDRSGNGGLDGDGRIHDEDRSRGYVLRPVFSDGGNGQRVARRVAARAHPNDHGFAPRQDDGGARGNPPPPNNDGGAVAAPPHRQVHPRPRIDMRWRFVSDPMDMPHRPPGAYIRLTVGGRDVPTYVVRRSPTGNWGFLLESCWGLYASFDLPRRGAAADDGPASTRGDGTARGGASVPDDAAAAAALVDGPIAVPPPPPPPLVPAGPMGVPIPGARMRLRRTRYGGRWMNVDGIESEDEDDRDARENNREDEDRGASLLNDAAMTVTNGTQWREALLYNYGAVTLPDGSGAAEEFDRVWSESLRFGRARNNVEIRR